MADAELQRNYFSVTLAMSGGARMQSTCGGTDLFFRSLCLNCFMKVRECFYGSIFSVWFIC